MKKRLKSIPKIKSNNNSISISIRINNKVTSISLRKNLVTLWLLLDNSYKKWKTSITNFVYYCSDEWKGDSAKGFSDFVSEKLFESVLDHEDFVLYKKILKRINLD